MEPPTNLDRVNARRVLCSVEQVLHARIQAKMLLDNAFASAGLFPVSFGQSMSEYKHEVMRALKDMKDIGMVQDYSFDDMSQIKEWTHHKNGTLTFTFVDPNRRPEICTRFKFKSRRRARVFAKLKKKTCVYMDLTTTLVKPLDKIKFEVVLSKV